MTVSIGQEKEYVVTKGGDTLYGIVSRATKFLNPSKVIFKIKILEGDKKLLDPSEIKTIRSFKGVDGDCTIKTAYDKWFVKMIIDGRIKVYQLIDGVIFFTSKDNSEIVLTDFGGFNSRKESQTRIKSLVQDNAKILKEFDTLKGTQKEILYIIEKYNNLEK
ncbi:hypothetical protein L0P88_16340 [Muricauda sp. SCSIO 64092]|uniref:hypothetical protein n=1 Tax=Allomuricauda sp. SCSIO 64092 TaxID=2908842 RepID=UPI001FF67F10|nr:hypothetical protein [Muricauda sp. SCSIO 64092]UOY05511.1 hypothetical protein L0P88_16340 [Muricauda sp. SCSIO 64092]